VSAQRGHVPPFLDKHETVLALVKGVQLAPVLRVDVGDQAGKDLLHGIELVGLRGYGGNDHRHDEQAIQDRTC
jgi:hypothetical protein